MSSFISLSRHRGISTSHLGVSDQTYRFVDLLRPRNWPPPSQFISTIFPPNHSLIWCMFIQTTIHLYSSLQKQYRCLLSQAKYIINKTLPKYHFCLSQLRGLVSIMFIKKSYKRIHPQKLSYYLIKIKDFITINPHSNFS